MELATTQDNRHTNDETIISPIELLESLQRRADSLLQEFRSYQTHLKSKQLAKHVELRIFRRGVEAEHQNLDAIAKRDHPQDQSHGDPAVEPKDYEAKRLQALRSSNLPFHEAVWATAKQCKGIRALGKRLYWDDGQTGKDQKTPQVDTDGQISKRKKFSNALVDIVADDGAQWVKVSIVTAKRLIFEMAKEGLDGYIDDSESGDSDDKHSSSGQDSAGKLEIVRLAEDLRAASRATRVKYRHPEVKFILPRLREGHDEHIDAIIADIRATGAIVLCGEACSINVYGNGHADSQTILNVDRMLPSSGYPHLTSTLNIDCTILLALISDVSHIKRPDLPPSPGNSSGIYHTAILKQIESEEKAALLPSELYPMLCGRKLVCTGLAAQRMREIVQTMGTESETSRADILLGEGDYQGVSPEQLSEAWRALSCHNFPDAVVLPINVDDFTFPPRPSPSSTQDTSPDFPDANHTIHTPQLAHRLCNSMRLSPINASVFIYAWLHSIVTITSNRVVAAGIERHLNELLDEDEKSSATLVNLRSDEGKKEEVEEFVGPKMYVIETARSLVGKEKGNGLRP